MEGFDPKTLNVDKLPLEDRWILSRLTSCINEMNAALAAYQFSAATQAVYRFFWDDYCNWYIEMSKSRLSGDDANTCKQVLVHVLDQALRLLHPIAPFVTEAVWEEMNKAIPRRGLKSIEDTAAREPALIAAAWPATDASLMDAEIDRRMALIQSIIGDVRESRTTINGYRSKGGQSAVKTLPSATILVNPAQKDFLSSYHVMICSLSGCDAIEIRADKSKPDKALGRVRGLAPVFVPVTGLVDLAEVAKDLEKQLTDLLAALVKAEAQLANEGFVSRADPAMVDQARARAAQLAQQIAALEDQLAGLA